MKPLIWVEGIIGSGKTTLCREIAKRLNLRNIEEPVDSNPYLSLFYGNPKKWAFPMQVFLLHRRYAAQQLASYECTPAGSFNGAVLDRSIAGDRVFAILHRDCGNIEMLDWQTYEEAYSIMARSLLPPALLVWLDVQPITAYERMKKRSRTAEAGVPLDYLEKLRTGYQDLMREAERGLTPWAHAIRVYHALWDPDTLTEHQWDATVQTIQDACRQR